MTRALIVDDIVENRYLLRALLEGHGFTVDDARNGAEALLKARLEPPDLAISDLLMPEVDGYSLLRQWRADARLRSLPFIVYTATYTEPRDEWLAMALGADAFIVKPAEPEALMRQVRGILDKKARGELPSAAVGRAQDQQALLEEHNQTLIRKLEKKAREAQRSNVELREEMAERERTEQELRDSEARYRATFEHAAVGIAHVGIDGRFLLVNDRLCQITGYSSDDLLRMTFIDLTHPADREESTRGREELLAGTQTAFTMTKRYRSKNGATLWANVMISLLRTPTGQPNYFISVIVDITEQMRAEEALQLRDRAIQTVSQGILITDARQPDHPIIYASAGFERMTGYAPEQVLGRNCRFLQGKDTDRTAVSTLREAISLGRACAVELVNYRQDGTPFWNALSITPVRDEAGTLLQFVGVQNDVTARRKLEDELRQAQKMEAVGRLAGGVAHDFNNLLTIIGGYTEQLLASSALSEEDRDAIKAISAAGDRAAALTRQLLGFSRKTILQPQVLDIKVVVTENVKLLRRLLGADIAVTTALDPGLNAVFLDPSQLDQVLMNLAVNARDAMPKGGKLTIEATNVVLSEEYASAHFDCKPGPHVMIAMTDSGCGMPPEILERIFEPFFTTKEIDKGTGLGLAMVFGIVRQSGGCIHVYSEPDHGSTFKLYFPAILEHVAPPSAPEPKTDVRGTETVLLVEDEPSVRALAQRILETYGYRILSAKDGAEALALIEGGGGPLDLVLSDVVMPNMSGPELMKALRMRFPKLKALFMSGYTDGAVVQHGLLDAGYAFIQKPYTAIALARQVRRVLDEAQDDES